MIRPPMREFDCEFEAEVLAAAVQSRWPDRVDEDLRAHVRTCGICSDVAAVAGAIDAARDEIRGSIVVPDSGRVWWLAQLRARREAARTAGRPITAAQVIAFGCSVALLGACFGAMSTWFQSALQWVVASVMGIDMAGLTLLLVEHGALAAAMVAVILLVPAAVYLTVRGE
jgi:hypothetical protein